MAKPDPDQAEATFHPRFRSGDFSRREREPGPKGLNSFESPAPADWATDGQFLYVRRGNAIPEKIERLEIATGRAEPWRDLVPADATGLIGLSMARITPDGRAYAYTTQRLLSDLFLVEGVR